MPDLCTCDNIFISNGRLSFIDYELPEIKVLDFTSIDIDCHRIIATIAAIFLNTAKTLIPLEKKYSALGKKRCLLSNLIHKATIFDMLYDVANNEIKTTGKVFGILIEPKYIS